MVRDFDGVRQVNLRVSTLKELEVLREQYLLTSFDACVKKALELSKQK